MIAHVHRPRSAPVLLSTAILWLAAVAPAGAQAGTQVGDEVGVKARYTISMNAVTIGHVTWTVEIGAFYYRTTARGKASGILSFLVNGEGGVTARGTVENGHLVPAEFTSQIVDEDGKTELHILYEDGVAREQITQGAATPKDRIPVTDEHRRGVADPLSAVLMTATPGGAALAPANCNRVMAIFDGRRRYNLALSYLRNERVKMQHGYSGPVLVCGVVLQPIAGYRRDSLLVKYVAGRRDMELWFAPISGTDVMAPIRVLMPTLVGTLKIDADAFEIGTVAPPPAPPALPPPDAPPVR